VEEEAEEEFSWKRKRDVEEKEEEEEVVVVNSPPWLRLRFAPQLLVGQTCLTLGIAPSPRHSGVPRVLQRTQGL
jgi:hypothetical protein